MGLFSGLNDAFKDLGDFFTEDAPDALGLPRPGDLIDDFSGKSGQEAAERAAQSQLGFHRESREMFRPIVEAGIAQLPALAESATAGGFGKNIGDILSGGSLDPLIQKRQQAADQQMASRGLRRSGGAIQQAANIPTDLAMQIEGELNRRRQSLAGQGQQGAGSSSSINTMMGDALAGSALAGQQATAQGSSNAMGLIRGLMSMFSDVRLKDNIRNIGEHDGLAVIEWTWNREAQIRYGLTGISTGFIAQEVAVKRPECVGSKDGFLTIDYKKLLGEVA